MSITILENCSVLDVAAGTIVPDRHILIRDGVIQEIEGHRLNSSEATRVDVRGRTVMPGLCDAHVHVAQLASDTRFLRDAAPSYVAAQASVVMRDMLLRGFTTVRDCGGADYGIADAVEHGLFVGPRILFSGHALSQTGGHGDQRTRGENYLHFSPECMGRSGRVCDGVDEVRRAARDELRKGASQIKIMASGGVTSPLDHTEETQFSLAEITAAVEEAEAKGKYVVAHAYSPTAINRSLECGVRSIEHGNMMDEATAKNILSRNAFLVPTIVVYWASLRDGKEAGMPEVFYSKVQAVHDTAMRGFEIAHRAGVRMAYGTDLFGTMHSYQSYEFSLRAEVQSPIEIIRSATTNAADLFNMSGSIGEIKVGAFADLLVVNGDPTRDITLLQEQGRHLDVIMKGGKFIINRLS
ncbi:amidohydrolase family protein [Ensifer sp. 4252]|uniref:metal-dependent hydrolase family protein n=1 Tax=Ensifer sp. 4252 TaxID=3373915 RepID=UPI003D21EDDA